MVRQTPPFHVCVHVLLAPPSVLGAWSMILLLWLPINYYYYYQLYILTFFLQENYQYPHCRQVVGLEITLR